MSEWLFDLGNTRLKCAPLLADGRVGEVQALAHREADIAAELERVLPARIDVAHIASVASEALRVALIEALVPRCSRIGLAGTQAAFAGLCIAYAQPQRLGVDRFLAMLGARMAEPGPVLVCGVGTALTLDLVDIDGHHHGGRIAPSPTLMRESLHQRAPQLPPEGGVYRMFATDTNDGLASGCEGAALALIRETHAAATTLLGMSPKLMLHGGGSEWLVARLEGAVLAPALVLEGLAGWAIAEWPPQA
ncbi:type III pantothenate kinase [Lysobacter korlensis]|uniref:Type III pantothenate kinase n=1 Tax=Lysobacter korlensis TaxID=553636 RepID=A0ABV6RIJ3_9GAMM